MKKILSFRWEILVGLNFALMFVFILSLGINDAYDLLLSIMYLVFIPLSYVAVKVARRLMKEVWL